MKLTKYEHACVVLEEQKQRIIIDPGKFSSSLSDFSNTVAIVITHIHSDHFDTEKINAIKQASPSVRIFSNQQVANENPELGIVVVKAGDVITEAGFTLEFFGGEHEYYDEFENVAVLVSGKFYHPGDSYTPPGKPIEVLGLPASAPWLRVRDAVDFLLSLKPKIAIPIHNSLLSEIGESIHYRILGEAASASDIAWRVLKPGESMDI